MRYFIYNSPAFKSYLDSSSHVRGEVEFLRLITRKGMVGMDIGGNVGVTTVTMAKEIGEEGKVYAFEPNPGNIEALKRNLAINGLKNVKLIQMAVSDKVGEVDFYGSTIIPEEGAQRRRVKTISLDRFADEERLERVDLINMDCEGSELLVLRGAEKTLQNNDVKIFCEVHHGFLERLGQSVQDIVSYLESLGFQVYGVSLEDLSLKEEIDKPEYIFAAKRLDL
ncbi:FkbM family methyltransferase [Candidatus Poribacteria bacterium]|nr:FkbM family methyltransferase [Candidatus Poribacteria bacterium]